MKIVPILVLTAVLVGCSSQKTAQSALPLSKADPGKQIHQGMIAHPENPYFFNFVGALAETDLKDNPEAFLSPFEGKMAIIWDRLDAGELYGHRLALRHMRNKTKSEYNPSPNAKDTKFIKGFLEGYNSTMRGSAKKPSEATP